MAFRIICRLDSDYNFELKYLHVPNTALQNIKKQNMEKFEWIKKKIIERPW